MTTDEFRKLLAAATARPWVATGSEIRSSDPAAIERQHAHSRALFKGKPDLIAASLNDYGGQALVGESMHGADAQLAAAAVNGIEGHLDELDRLRELKAAVLAWWNGDEATPRMTAAIAAACAADDQVAGGDAGKPC